ncbi:MAG: hypothetical protein ACP5HI_03830 [Caldimicrobium sp.]|jgi:hypothetical protein
MKLLIIFLLIFVIFWYYRRKKIFFQKIRKKVPALKIEMKSCENCGIFFSESEGYHIERDHKELFFCSEKCLKEFLSKERV